jgi:hypothetical protein
MIILILIMAYIPVLKSLRAIEQSLTNVEKNTNEMIIKINKFDKYIELIKSLE